MTFVDAFSSVAAPLPATIPAVAKRAEPLICFSHLRWNFVYQRPQHLMTRFAHHMPVFFVEEPIWINIQTPRLDIHSACENVTIVVPQLPHSFPAADVEAVQKRLLDELWAQHEIQNPTLWYYTPMSLAFSNHLAARKVIYDCMDELSAFRGAPPALIEREKRLLEKADVVFTGGHSLYQAKRNLHRSVHAFPSSVDVAHFRRARQPLEEPADQRDIPHPRIGHYAVLDERLDIALLAKIADARPDWHLILVGPIVKIDPQDLPQRPNIHYLGGKTYDELPAYLAGWDVAFMPFALNESTRFISPTKTPEYLAAGKPVISTPITDVIGTYGDAGLVQIAATPQEFETAISEMLAETDRSGWLEKVDCLLDELSWDKTWLQMKELMDDGR